MNKKKIFWWLSGGVSLDTDYQAWLTQIIADGGTQPSVAVRAAQNALVLGLKSASLWTRGKFFYELHAGDLTTGRRNLFNPATFRTTLSGSNVFTDGQGTKSDGTSFINTTYAANQYAGIQTDITIMMYISTSSTSGVNQAPYGTRVAGVGDIWFMYPRESGTNLLNRRHFLSAGVTGANANHKGFYCHTYDGTNDVVYKDGVKDSDAATPVAPTIANPLLILARNTNAVGGATGADHYTTGNVAYIMAFDRFNDSDESTLRGLLTTYNAACSIP